MKSLIISYTLENVDINQRGAIQRALNGYIDYSNKGAYKYERQGLIEQINCIKLNRGVIIVPEKYKNKILSILKENKATVKTIPVDVSASLFE